MADGRKIKARMDDLGIKGVQLAEMIGVDRPRISQLINGRYTNLTEKTLYKLCDALQCSPEDIK